MSESDDHEIGLLRAENEALWRRATDAEELVRRTESRIRAVFEKSGEAISLTNAAGKTEYLTSSVSRLLGFSPEEMGGRAPRDLVVPEDRARLGAELERMVRTGLRDLAIDFRVQHRDGSIRWIESLATNLLDDPDVRAIVGNYRDVTAHRRSDEALREGRDRLEEAQAIAHIGSWSSNLRPSSGVVWSPECYRILGLPVGTPVQVESFFERVHPEDRERVRRARQAAVEADTPYDIEHRIERPDGRVCWVHQRAVVERDAAGGAIRIGGTVQDITDRHVAGEALRASEERYRRIVEGTSEGVWMYDPAGITTFMNARMARMLGCTVAEAVGHSVYTFVAEADRPLAKQRTERRRRGVVERGDFRFRRKDGTELWGLVQSSPLFDAAGRFEATLALVADVSQQRRSEEARARLAAIVESSEDAILSVTPDGTITTWNVGAEKLYEYSAVEMVGKPIEVLRRASSLDEAGLLGDVARGEAVHQYETTRVRMNGTEVEVAVTLSPIRDPRGMVVGVSSIERDLTSRRRAEAALRHKEEQFRQAQKMEAVGRLAGGVAHDFNNLLSVVLGYATLAVDDLKLGDPLREDLEQIVVAGERATDLTRQLLAFSRQQVLQPRVLDLNQTLAGMKSMLGRLLGEDIELSTSMALDAGRVLADPGQIEQVLMNLAVNARDAMPDGGQLTIETANVELDAAYVAVHLGVAAGEYVMLAVSDTGSGMDAATRARIFEPFFTTKEKGKGTGLGLSTVFGIVEQSGGHVGVYSEPGHGSTFKIYLPRTDRTADSTLAARLPAVIGGAETILLVEDEEQVRAVACAILRRNGYHVLEGSNGGEAFLISRDFAGKIHLLLTDVVMPRMSGRKLAEELGPLRPDMRILFASGYTDDAIVHHGMVDAGVAFLQKPFTPDALLRKVREVLDGRGSSRTG